jgi:hypothetical protein
MTFVNWRSEGMKATISSLGGRKGVVCGTHKLTKGDLKNWMSEHMTNQKGLKLWVVSDRQWPLEMVKGISGITHSKVSWWWQMAVTAYSGDGSDGWLRWDGSKYDCNEGNYVFLLVLAAMKAARFLLVLVRKESLPDQAGALIPRGNRGANWLSIEWESKSTNV